MVNSKGSRRAISPRIWIVAAVAVIALGGLFFAGRTLVLQRLYPFKYREEIVTYAKRNGLDPLFVASIIHNESRFNPSAVSKKGAVGLMQIMPDTGRWVAEQMGFSGFDPEMLRDPATNIMIGSWYLADLKGEFGGKLVPTVAAYNCGRGKVKEWLTKEGVDLGPSIAAEVYPWPPKEVVEDFPVARIQIKETRNYVIGVMTSLKRYRQLYEGEVTGAGG